MQSTAQNVHISNLKFDIQKSLTGGKKLAKAEEIIVVTTNDIPGKKIVKTLGLVEARCKRFVLHEEKSARENLIKKAREMGANAILGYSYYKLWARGTAVIVE